MSRSRLALGTLSVAVGGILAAEGARGLQRALRLALELAPVVLIILGIVGLLRALAPAAAWAGPVLLMGGGLAWIALRTGSTRYLNPINMVAAGLILLGLIVALMPTQSEATPVDQITATALLLPRVQTIQYPPHKILARAVLTQLTIDLTRTTSLSNKEVDIDVQVYTGRVLLLVPSTWHVEPGRMHATYRLSLSGTVDMSGKTTQAPEKATATRPGRAASPIQPLVKLHILGFLGSVSLVRAL